MNTTPKQSKWKTWHKVVLGILVVFFGLMAIAVNSDDTKPAAIPAPTVLTAADSVKARTAIIEKAFSSWDGAHIKLKEYVKENMNDPSSFEAGKTNYWDRDSFIMVKMEYRGKNAFNAVVKDVIMAKCAIDGTILKIVKQ